MADSVTTADAPWTLKRLLTWTTQYLSDRDVEEPRLATEVLLASASNRRRIDLYTRFDELLPPDQLDRFRAWITRAAAGEPIAYIVGEKEFYSLAFHVTPDVLIPRPETELLVEWVVDHCHEKQWPEPKLFDLGTGSGCIVIAALAHLPQATAVATDVNPKCLEVAKQNARRHKVANRLSLVEANQLDLPDGHLPQDGFHVLMSNPPYIAAEEMETLPVCIRDFEPSIALTDKQDGLSFYRNIAGHADRLLTPDGVVLVEIGDGKAEAVIDVMTSEGALTHVTTKADRVVGRERMLVFRRKDKVV